MQYLEVRTKIDDERHVFTLVLNYKRMKNIVFRVREDALNTFNVSLPYGISLSQVEKVFLANLPSLLKLEAKAKTVPFSDKTYLFGNYLPLYEIKDTFEIKHEIPNLDVYYKVMNKTLLNVLKTEVTYYSERMKIPDKYKVRIRSMKTRWATNSKQTMTLTFNEKLIHYNIEIIRALVVHELVHYFINGHGSDFYAYCERYFPNYRQFDKMLKEHNYAGNYKYNKQ